MNFVIWNWIGFMWLQKGPCISYHPSNTNYDICISVRNLFLPHCLGTTGSCALIFQHLMHDTNHLWHSLVILYIDWDDFYFALYLSRSMPRQIFLDYFSAEFCESEFTLVYQFVSTCVDVHVSAASRCSNAAMHSLCFTVFCGMVILWYNWVVTFVFEFIEFCTVFWWLFYFCLQCFVYSVNSGPSVLICYFLCHTHFSMMWTVPPERICGTIS